ncbi:hypothetical protein [Burkholderia cepacia]|uniref:hypothetical protein n=1 Tax=Burkholderia cepacia TaxID=292 RepID=UPI002AB67B91|nr:hypothetical protein [Burkholderia cepacia]
MVLLPVPPTFLALCRAYLERLDVPVLYQPDTDERARFFQFVQQRWSADQLAANDSRSFTTRVAGQLAHLVETDDAWRLHSLGVRSERIDAQRAAPAFVRDALAHMMALAGGTVPRSATGDGS